MSITWTGVGVGIVGNRAMRCNNPGAVEHKGNRRWKGMMEAQRDPELVQFKSAFWGLVALARMLGKVERENGRVNTAYLLSNCYRGNTSKCIRFVLKTNRWAPHVVLSLSDDTTMMDVMASVCRYHCGFTARGKTLVYGSRMMQAAVRFAWPQWFNVQKEIIE